MRAPMTKDEARKTLGIEGKSDERSLKKAWQRAIFEAHPDRGGSTDDVERVQVAYRVMKGEPQAGASSSHAMDVFMQAFQQVMTKVGTIEDLKTVDMVASIRKELINSKVTCVWKLRQSGKELAMYREALSRFTCRRAADPVKLFLEQNVAGVKSLQSTLKAEIDDVDGAIAITNDYEYEHSVR